jgi:hypothetical protein
MIITAIIETLRHKESCLELSVEEGKEPQANSEVLFGRATHRRL